ncbi:hypothetical protein KDJ57_gp35 [Gordonia phage Catfish]|uniref:Uncharacterized protein n=1 Tax=Gordonia phage Catfish TaxID=2301538 RepID=A0A385D1R7_9CAUD|nr:hypothetical protein KDJ57_gp35 [Gordonia phage Catfish]AXQ51910.1 hypothetical protein SEA_CATFISH_74 [Gordonia phage Catfish]
MRVAELIEKLKACDPDALVIVRRGCCEEPDAPDLNVITDKPERWRRWWTGETTEMIPKGTVEL